MCSSDCEAVLTGFRMVAFLVYSEIYCLCLQVRQSDADRYSPGLAVRQSH